MIKAIIFDMDGVVVDSERFITKAEQITFREYGIELTDEDMQKLKGTTDDDNILYLRRKFRFSGTKEEIVEKRQKILLDLFEDLTVFPDFYKILPFIKKYRLALTTSASRKDMNWVFKKLSLDGIFSVIITADDVKQGKPNPEPYVKTIKMLELQPVECIVIEDTINGIDAAKAAGAKCVAVEGTFPKEKLAAADFIISNLEELPSLLS